MPPTCSPCARRRCVSVCSARVLASARSSHASRRPSAHRRESGPTRSRRNAGVDRETVREVAPMPETPGPHSRLMHTLVLRWERGTWVYDDAELGVYGEPFVLGADAILSSLRVVQVGPGREPFRVVFSAS